MNKPGENNNGSAVTEQVARGFLLGELDASERERIELLFLMDRETRETILVAEDDLVEDYLEGNLTAVDAEKFRERYATNSTERRRLRITDSIREYASANGRPSSTPIPIFKRAKIRPPRWIGNYRIAVPVFASLITVATITAIWIGLRVNRNMNEQRQQASVERQLAELNSPANMSTRPPQLMVMTVAPISTRSAQSSAQLTIEPEARILELSLLSQQTEEYASYQGRLSRVGGTKAFLLPPLHIEKDRNGRVVRLRLPLEILPSGLYRISLNGVAFDGTAGPKQEYDFQLIRR